MSRYEFSRIERVVQDRWREADEFRCPDEVERPYFALGMFPYPSGDPHMGHVRVYTITDVIARYKRLHGLQVMNPIGWDAFGLPAENAAIKSKRHPKDWTGHNIERMRDQLSRMGWSFDWSREINTSTPDFYRFTQWIFLQLLAEGTAYKAEGRVNWCPTCATVLANEQVNDGVCWRCGAAVEQRMMAQWFFRTTDYAEWLWTDIAKLGNWNSRAVAVQRNWINKSTGVEIAFPVDDGPAEPLRVYTTRADTLFGVTALVVAPEHPLVTSVLARGGDPATAEAIRAFGARAARDRILSSEKNGVPLHVTARHPLTHAPVPVWVGDYVIAEHGTGAVMCVPAHDVRDHEFARKYGLPIVITVVPAGDAVAAPDEAFTDDGVLVASGEFSGRTSAEAREAIADRLEAIERGRRRSAFNLRDWSIGRQRYWGCPIPIINCPDCGPVGVPEQDLPVLLAEDVQFDGGKAELPADSSWHRAACPRCGAAGRRETDTFDTFMDSSWYAYRFLDPRNEEQAFRRDLADRWMPISFYVGGLEHAAQHLLYFRFLTKFFHKVGLIGFDEPVDVFFCNGMVTKDGAKMSKSLGNVVSPDQAISRFGADALRLYILSNSPAEEDLDWTEDGLKGKYDFLARTYNGLAGWLERHRHPEWAARRLDQYSDQKALFRFYGLLDDLGRYLERYGFHQAVARIHELSNLMLQLVRDDGAAPSEADRQVVSFLAHDFLVVLGLFVPHLAQSLLWEHFDPDESAYHGRWPALEKDYLQTATVTCGVQVNGKTRGKVVIRRDDAEEAVIAAAREQASVARSLEGKTIRRTVYVPNRLINLIVE